MTDTGAIWAVANMAAEAAVIVVSCGGKHVQTIITVM